MSTYIFIIFKGKYIQKYWNTVLEVIPEDHVKNKVNQVG